MRNKILLVLLPLSLFSFEVNFSKSFNKELIPDTLTTNITIRVNGDNENKISNKLDKFNEVIKDNDEVEKRRGSLSVRPNYKYSSNNIPKINGYVGYLSYKVNSTSADKINTFINSITRIKKDRDTSITISNLTWRVKEDTKSVAKDIIRLEATHWALDYARNLSSDLRKKCRLEKISLNANRINPMSRSLSVKAMTNKSFSKVPAPQISGEKISSLANFIFECK